MSRRIVLRALPLLLIPPLFSAYSDYASMKRKIELIETDRARPGSRIVLTPQELNAFVQQQATAVAPEGVRDPKLKLGDGTATGAAMIDFLKVRRAQGKPPGWLLSQLLDGERPVEVTARISSGAGRARVDVQRVEISGMALPDSMLDYLIRNYLTPNFPAAKIGEPFELGHRIERLEVNPAAVGVVIGK